MRNMRGPALIAFLSLVALALVGCASQEVRDVRAMAIGHVDMQAARDGTYRGEYAYGSFTYAVDVTVADHRITEIIVVANRDTTHAKKAEGVLPRVLELQKNDVDAISGATTTSKALLKAIENAIRNAL
jgi:uncharacterized protein with FMN-binding domain